MLYLVIEHFKQQNALPVYQRFQERGRLAPAGLIYVASWVDVPCHRCFHVMETDDRALLDVWMANWNDLVDFDVIPVLTSADAARKVLSLASDVG